jgi:hypothetical protein
MAQVLPTAPAPAVPMIQQPQVNLRDARLDQIIQKAPPTGQEEAKSFLGQAKKFCATRIGLSLIGFIVVFVLLIALRPSYIYKRNSEDNFGLKHVNYALVSAIALISSLALITIPYLITKRS